MVHVAPLTQLRFWLEFQKQVDACAPEHGYSTDVDPSERACEKNDVCQTSLRWNSVAQTSYISYYNTGVTRFSTSPMDRKRWSKIVSMTRQRVKELCITHPRIMFTADKCTSKKIESTHRTRNVHPKKSKHAQNSWYSAASTESMQACIPNQWQIALCMLAMHALSQKIGCS